MREKYHDGKELHTKISEPIAHMLKPIIAYLKTLSRESNLVSLTKEFENQYINVHGIQSGGSEEGNLYLDEDTKATRELNQSQPKSQSQTSPNWRRSLTAST